MRGPSRVGLFFILPILVSLKVTPSIAQQGCSPNADFCWGCSDIGHYSNGSIYQKNLKSLLPTLSNSLTDYGFSISSLGNTSDKVYAMAFCRGDIGKATCQSCMNRSSLRILENCPNQLEAVLWDLVCTVRYSDRSMFGIDKEMPVITPTSPAKAQEPNLFNQTLNPLLNNLAIKAASSGSHKKYATGSATVPGYETIYALLQCSPDLDMQECKDCLEDSIHSIPQCCEGRQGARVLKPSCNLRYEVSEFYGFAGIRGCSDKAEYCWGCSDVGDYSNGSIYQKNLNSLLSSLSKSITDYGVSTSSLGNNSNKVYGMAFCRGDIDKASCQACVERSSLNVLENCPNTLEATLWDLVCTVRYSDRPMFGIDKEMPVITPTSPTRAQEPNLFRHTLNPLLNNLTIKAASGDSHKKYATGSVAVPGYETIYALLQCSPDLDMKECKDCLNDSVQSIPQCCEGRQGARVLKPSCNLRYEVGQFYNSGGGF